MNKWIIIGIILGIIGFGIAFALSSREIHTMNKSINQEVNYGTGLS